MPIRPWSLRLYDLAGAARTFTLMLLSAAFLCLATWVGAHAQAAVTRNSNIRQFGYTETVVTATAATTGFVDVASITNTPAVDPNGFSSPGYLGGSGYGNPPDFFYIWWSVDVSKATSTGASCKMFVNGAAIANSLRQFSTGASAGTLSGVLRVANTTTGVQTAKLQCNSLDTATATFNRVSLEVQEHY